MNIAPNEHYASRRSPVLTTGGAVASSQPLASAAGAEILVRGGSAADAAVAAAAALQVTQPCSTGLGGDCFCLYYEAASGRVFALNGSGRSPEALTQELLAREGFGRELPRFHAHTVTVPGAPAAWCDVVSRFGKLGMPDVLEPAIRLATDGFPVAPMAAVWWQAGVADQLLPRKHGGELLLPGGAAPVVGEVFRNPHLARTLELMAKDGSLPFYRGEIARRIIDAVREEGGVLAEDDLAAHRSEWTEPISVDYRGIRIYECPPNGQGLAALIALNILRAADLDPLEPPDSLRYHLLIESMRLAFADAARYVADPDFVDIPVERLLSRDYGRSRFELVHRETRMSEANVGLAHEPRTGFDTVYLCAVDSDGNGCSFINSNYMGFGTGIVPEGCGYTLQNRGHNFSLDPNHPNRIEPGKRPYHTIIPGLATDAATGALYATFGVMGGFMQPQGHLQVVSWIVDDGIDPQSALDRGRFQLAGGDPNGEVLIEDAIDAKTAARLEAAGHPLRVVSAGKRTSFGLGQIIMRTGDGVLWAGSDPRGDGCATPVQ